MSRKVASLLIMLCLVLGLGIAAILMQPGDRSDAKAKVSMLNIGQGDAFLIQAPSGAQLLIDAGRDGTVLSELAKVMPAGDHSIDAVIATHPDADHVGGLPLVLSRYDVGLFLTSDVFADTQVIKDVYAKIYDKKIPAYYARRGMNLGLDGSSNFKILFPDRNTHNWETNTASVVGRLQIGSRSALFTGDSPISIEEYLVKTSPEDINVDILKLGHHGSKTSSSEAFLRATSPGLALISAGVSNRYGHPHPEVLKLLDKLKIQYLSTQDGGTMTFASDGVTWSRER